MTTRPKKNGCSGFDFPHEVNYRPSRCGACGDTIPSKQSVFSLIVSGSKYHICEKCARLQFDKLNIEAKPKKADSKVKNHRIKVVSPNLMQILYIALAIGGTIEHKDDDNLIFTSNLLTSCYAGGHVFDEFRGQIKEFQEIRVLNKEVHNLEEYHKAVKSTSDWNESLR